MVNFNDLTVDEQIKCIEVMRAKDMEKVLNSTYNPMQIRLNRKAINSYYDNLIKELVGENNKKEQNEERLSKIV
jgi:DNA primase large subunit